MTVLLRRILGKAQRPCVPAVLPLPPIAEELIAIKMPLGNAVRLLLMREYAFDAVTASKLVRKLQNHPELADLRGRWQKVAQLDTLKRVWEKAGRDECF
ncbi:MAG: hypothetical protein WHV66_00140 [Anaerolineales bacterium]